MRTERQFVLGVDLDGVVADFARGLKPVAAEWLGLAEQQLTDEISYGFGEWGLEAAGGYDALHRFAVKERELFLRLPPVAGAPAALRRLDTIPELRIRIITHRLYIHWFHKEAIRQTTEWLERHGIPYWDLCFMRDKAAVGVDLPIHEKKNKRWRSYSIASSPDGTNILEFVIVQLEVVQVRYLLAENYDCTQDNTARTFGFVFIAHRFKQRNLFYLHWYRYCPV